MVRTLALLQTSTPETLMGLNIVAEGCKGKDRKNTMPGVRPEGEIRSSNKFPARLRQSNLGISAYTRKDWFLN
jgi:hypothetical protein